MKQTSDKEIRSVLSLDGPARFSYFVKKVADAERAWGLWKDGWALLARTDDVQVFPLWPAREYAERCRVGDIADYEPREIPLSDLLDELLPKLSQRGVLPGVFPTPEGKGVTPTVEELSASLRNEAARYDC